LQVEVTLRSGGLEIRTKGSISDLSKDMSSISSFAELAASKLVPIGQTAEEDSRQVVLEETRGEAPVIKVTKRTPENVNSLFNTRWGKSPRTRDEIVKALEINAAPDTATNISVALLRLVRRGKLRRIKKAGKWIYFRIPA
jgi:hypothetical protein